MTTSIILIILLIFFNGIFASAEVALIAVNSSKVDQDAQNGNKKAIKLQRFINKPSLFLSTIQIGITLFGFLNGGIASDAFSEPILALFPSTWDQNILKVVIRILISLILAYFQVVLGELVPKRIGMKWPEKISYALVGFLNLIASFMRPVVWLFTVSANVVGRLFGIDPDKGDDNLSEEEIRLMVAASGKKGKIHQSESDMIDNIFEFDDTTVDEIMTHRTEVASIRADETIDEIIDYVKDERFTRFPVYEESIDQIIGTLHTKDLLQFYDEDKRSTFNIKDILREPYFVPDSKKTSALFREMQQSKRHIAIVIDEYGGTAGIVTIEDLIEEIVGNIFDEYDDVELEIETVNEDEYIIEGLTSLEDVEDHIHAGLPIDEYDTLSGFIIGQIGRFPEVDEAIKIRFQEYDFEVLNFEDMVIDKVKVTHLSEEQLNEEKEENE